MNIKLLKINIKHVEKERNIYFEGLEEPYNDFTRETFRYDDYFKYTRKSDVGSKTVSNTSQQ